MSIPLLGALLLSIGFSTYLRDVCVAHRTPVRGRDAVWTANGSKNCLQIAYQTFTVLVCHLRHVRMAYQRYCSYPLDAISGMAFL